MSWRRVVKSFLALLLMPYKGMAALRIPEQKFNLRWLRFLATSLTLIATLSANARDHIEERAFWEDSSALASVEVAKQQVLTPFNGVLSRGYGTGAIWVRLTVSPSAEPLVLHIIPPWLDDITVYDPINTQGPLIVGDRHERENNGLVGLNHALPLPPSAQARDIWLRLQTRSARLLDVEVLTMAQYSQTNAHRIFWSTLYTAAMLLITVLLLPVWWVQRDSVLGTFLVKHVVYTYYSAAYLGLPTLLFSHGFSPDFFNHAFTYSVLLIAPLSLWFDHAYLSLYRPHRHLLLLLKILIACSIGNLIGFILGQLWPLETNLILMLIATMVVMLTALSTQPDEVATLVMPKKILIFYYAIILSSLPLGLISLLGLFEPREWTLYVLILHGLIVGMVMAGLLFVRAHRLSQYNQHITWQLHKVQQDIAIEQKRREEQKQFLYMLMHELKTPLSVMSLVIGNRNSLDKNLPLASEAVQEMNAIIERCVHVDQIGEPSMQLNLQSVQLPELIGTITNTVSGGVKDRLHTHIEPIEPVQTDGQLLKIIISNLLDNAIRYSDPVTPIHIGLQRHSQHGQGGFAVRISNTPGLAGWPDTNRLFSRYYRSIGAQRDSGSGLGLYLSRQLATSLGGSIDYKPTRQHVEFVLWMPLKHA